MATIHEISIKNFRGIKEFKQSFYKTNFICLIGRGDSGKSTILEAISYVLSSSWNLTFYDSDFFNCDTTQPIIIEATLTDIPDFFLNEKFGLHLRMINDAGTIIDDPEIDQGKPALTIQLKVENDLEPHWFIVNDRPNQADRDISATARGKFNTFLISDYTDRQFSWGRGNPLNSLLRNEENDEDNPNNIVINALRKAKQEIDNSPFEQLQPVIDKITSRAKEFGVDISGTNTTIDFKDIAIKDNRVCLHDESKVPFRLKGKGAKRLISLSIQIALANENGIILIDEIEQGLEPDRVQHLVSQLKKMNTSQVFMTTHSSNVVVELYADDFFIMRNAASNLLQVGPKMQDCIRKNPEALLAKKIIMCEGATEIGICRAINEYRILLDKENASYSGVRFADGSGSNFINYCKGFNRLGFPLIVFCDSDDPAINTQKKDLTKLGVQINECENNHSIEQQVFKDLQWDGVIELVKHRIEDKGIESIKSTFLNAKLGNFPEDWENEESAAFRNALGKAAGYKKEKIDGNYEDKSWFKRIDHGLYLGTVICKYYEQMENNHLKQMINNLSKFMDNV